MRSVPLKEQPRRITHQVGTNTPLTLPPPPSSQVRSVPLKEQPRRITHQEGTKSFGVITLAATVRGEAGGGG